VYAIYLFPFLVSETSKLDAIVQVGYLVKKRSPPLLVQNYALGGETVSGVRGQVTRDFMVRHPPAMPWTSRDSIFCTWVGINDLAYVSDIRLYGDPTDLNFTLPAIHPTHSQVLTRYSNSNMSCTRRGHETSYLLMSLLWIAPQHVRFRLPFRYSYSIVIHIDRALRRQNPQTRFFNWNATLDKAIRTFVAEKSTVNDPVSAIYFSAHKVFSALLDNPTNHEFPQGDIGRSGGSIWKDHLHPTSAVHLVVANELDGFLSGIPPFTSPAVTQTQSG
jgi:hypothetical protein